MGFAAIESGKLEFVLFTLPSERKHASPEIGSDLEGSHETFEDIQRDVQCSPRAILPYCEDLCCII